MKNAKIENSSETILDDFQTLCRLQSFGFRKASMYICKVGNKWMPEMLHFSSMLHEFYSSICGIFRILSSKLTLHSIKTGKTCMKISASHNELLKWGDANLCLSKNFGYADAVTQSLVWAQTLRPFFSKSWCFCALKLYYLIW